VVWVIQNYREMVEQELAEHAQLRLMA
jgi:hypothetical protein